MFIVHRFILQGFEQRRIGTAPIISIAICNTDGQSKTKVVEPYEKFHGWLLKFFVRILSMTGGVCHAK